MKYLLLILVLTGCTKNLPDSNVDVNNFRTIILPPTSEVVYRKIDIMNIENNCLMDILLKYNELIPKERIFKVLGKSFHGKINNEDEIKVIDRYFASEEFICFHNRIQRGK